MPEIAKRDSAEMRYLLGTLSEDEKTRLEEGFFTDDAKFEELELAEEELVDAYIREELSGQELQQFEARIRTSPRLLERVHFARALADRVDSVAASERRQSVAPAVAVSSVPAQPRRRWWTTFFPPQPAWGMALAAGTLLFFTGNIVLLVGGLRVRSEFARERTELQQQQEQLNRQLADHRTRAEQLATALQQKEDQHAEDLKLIEEYERASKLRKTNDQQSILSTIATVLLTTGATRSGKVSQRELIIGPNTKTARMRVILENNDYQAYNAALKTVDETEIRRWVLLKPHHVGSSHQLNLSLPASLLKPDDYVVSVDGVSASGQIEPVPSYQFRVKTRN